MHFYLPEPYITCGKGFILILTKTNGQEEPTVDVETRFRKLTFAVFHVRDKKCPPRLLLYNTPLA